MNGFRQEGFGPFDKHVYKGQRLSASRAYLHPAMKRENLTVKTRAFVTSIDFDGTRAKGLTYQRNGKTHQVKAGEVILSGGAINTPQLLQLSGVGDAEHLRSLGIKPVVDLPGVGENLQDHLEVYVQHACPIPVSEQPNLKKARMPWIGLQWMLGRTGPAATNHFEGGGFVRSNEDVDYPNLMFHFLPVAVRYDGQKAPYGSRIPSSHWTDVLGCAWIIKDSFERPERASEHGLQLSFYGTRQTRVGGSD